MPAYGNSYFPVGYQPMYPQQYQQPIVQQPQLQGTQMSLANQSQNSASILWVHNSQEAAMYPVAPNNAVVLWDSGSPVIYLKQADASGKPTMKTYDLVERPETPQNASNAGESSDTTYATKSELAALAGIVKDVDGIIASIREDVDTLKSKASAKRVKKEEDDNG